MSLKTYRQKRRFRETPEPRGEVKAHRGPLLFVVQKHHASRLHYDFRLELDGTMKSWAVPKGPSLNPADKRLAMMVEDHPLDYRTFEGIIPAGNYGSGRVIVWDEGTYEAVGTHDRTDSEKVLRAGLAAGRLSFVMHGHKLKGEFALVKMHRGEANAWLLMKKRDDFASDEDVTANEQSVRSGRTMDDIGTQKPVLRPKAKPRRSLAKRKTVAGMPHDVRPMLATLVDHPFDRKDWVFEVKWDGYRAIAEVNGDEVRLYSRNHNSFESKFAPVVESLRRLGHDAVLDGEIVVVDAEGKSRFQLLQNYQKTGKGNLVYYVFDLLYVDGRDLREQPLRERKDALKKLLRRAPNNIRLSDHVETNGVEFFEAAVKAGLEGIIGKDATSAYKEGRRSDFWVKIKSRQRQEAVIGGFTAPRGRRVGIGALVLGVYADTQLKYIGHTGGGLDDAGLADLRKRLEPLAADECPFANPPRTKAPVRGVEPSLVCEVEFQEWTEDGHMRQPIFVGLREDKPAKSVRREVEIPAEDVVQPTQSKKSRSASESTSKPEPKLTNLNKVYWPGEGITKGDLIDYYREIAPVLLPYLRDRPMSLHRHPNGIAGDSFFQKDVSKQPPPEWVKTVLVPSDGPKAKVEYILCQDEATLLYVANLGCIELNPWTAHMPTLDRPDFLVIDLDPEAIGFDKVIEAALAVRRVLESADATCLCKTSGKRGLHLCVPLGANYDFDLARQFSQLVAQLVNEKLPSSTSLERSPARRQKRVYLDYLQNRRGQTLASPYSVRPAPGATVSTPLRWSEVKKGLDPKRFTMATILRRLDRVGDLWKPISGRGVNLERSVRRLSTARGGS